MASLAWPRLARQYAPKHIGLNEKNKYKIFHAARWHHPPSSAGRAFFHPACQKNFFIYYLYRARHSGPHAKRRHSGRQTRSTGPSQPVFSAKGGKRTRPPPRATASCKTAQLCAARAQIRYFSIIGLDEPPGQVHSVPACRFKNPGQSGPGAKGLKKILKLCPTRCILRQSLMRL